MHLHKALLDFSEGLLDFSDLQPPALLYKCWSLTQAPCDILLTFLSILKASHLINFQHMWL